MRSPVPSTRGQTLHWCCSRPGCCWNHWLQAPVQILFHKENQRCMGLVLAQVIGLGLNLIPRIQIPMEPLPIPTQPGIIGMLSIPSSMRTWNNPGLNGHHWGPHPHFSIRNNGSTALTCPQIHSALPASHPYPCGTPCPGAGSSSPGHPQHPRRHPDSRPRPSWPFPRSSKWPFHSRNSQSYPGCSHSCNCSPHNLDKQGSRRHFQLPLGSGGQIIQTNSSSSLFQPGTGSH